jgi:release factor glutamine methyltransferase
MSREAPGSAHDLETSRSHRRSRAGTDHDTNVPEALETLAQLVRSLTDVLAAGAVDEPRREASDIVAALGGQPRFWAQHAPHSVVDAEFVRQAHRAARRRAAGAPFAYAVGRAAFRHLTLRVDARVLIPRQETEQLVELVLEHLAGRNDVEVLDIGTGSGAIAIALATEGRARRVVGTDVSSDALAVARENVLAMSQGGADARVELRAGAAYTPVRGEVFDVIVSNPPYIAYQELADLPGSVRDWEPSAALSCGDGGLEVTRENLTGAPAHLRSGGLLALEVDERRAREVAELAAATAGLCNARVRLDLAGRERFMLATCA